MAFMGPPWSVSRPEYRSDSSRLLAGMVPRVAAIIPRMAFGRRPSTPLEERLGYRFKRPDLLELALTHRSWANEQGIPEHYERLEFLGDSVLGLISAEWLYLRHPELPEGELSKLK